MKSQDIMVPIDFSDASVAAIDAAEGLAGRGQIFLLHVVDDDFIRHAAEAGFGGSEQVEHRMVEDAKRRLDRIIATRRDAARFQKVVVRGRPFAEILRMSRELDFDLIVIAHHGRHHADMESLLFGSTAEKVIRGSSVPVFCIPTVPRLSHV